MNGDQSNLNQTLRLGIEAARSGKSAEAQRCLRAVLAQQPDNIPALLWLAFVLPSPQESIHLLERVLTLQPNNERAQAGLRWAQERLSPSPQPLPEPPGRPSAEQTRPTAPTQPATVPTTPVEEEGSLREKFLKANPAEVAQKGPLAQRARRTFNQSNTIVLILIGMLSVMAAALAVLTVMPTDTLAAWLAPVSDSPVLLPAGPAETTLSGQRYSFASATDTIPLETARVGAAQMALEPEIIVPALDKMVNASTSAEIDPEAAAPVALIGPAIVADAPAPEPNLPLAHRPAHPDEKWIEVNVTTQQITAWEGTTPVFSFVGSTGLPHTPTVLGKFNIYWKLESTLMVGPDYYLPEVPYTMYFYAGYALHGAYWHNNFGQPMSHGCVNLSIEDSKKLFEWADPVIPSGYKQVTATVDNPGTLVVVHE